MKGPTSYLLNILCITLILCIVKSDKTKKTSPIKGQDVPLKTDTSNNVAGGHQSMFLYTRHHRDVISNNSPMESEDRMLDLLEELRSGLDNALDTIEGLHGHGDEEPIDKRPGPTHTFVHFGKRPWRFSGVNEARLPGNSDSDDDVRSDEEETTDVAVSDSKLISDDVPADYGDSTEQSVSDSDTRSTTLIVPPLNKPTKLFNKKITAHVPKTSFSIFKSPYALPNTPSNPWLTNLAFSGNSEQKTFGNILSTKFPSASTNEEAKLEKKSTETSRPQNNMGRTNIKGITHNASPPYPHTSLPTASSDMSHFRLPKVTSQLARQGLFTSHKRLNTARLGRLPAILFIQHNRPSADPSRDPASLARPGNKESLRHRNVVARYG